MPTADKARAFIEQKSCDLTIPTDSSGVSACKQHNTPFILSSFGSNSIALQDVRSKSNTYFLIATATIALLGAIIMMGTVGRMIADSRRETAVFRAIGAKKFDIVHIYILYALAMSSLVAVFSLAVGYGTAYFIDGRWAAQATAQATLVYNVQDPVQAFSLLKVVPRDMVLLVIVILASGIIGTALPLARNIRRNPIKDMRDES